MINRIIALSVLLASSASAAVPPIVYDRPQGRKITRWGEDINRFRIAYRLKLMFYIGRNDVGVSFLDDELPMTKKCGFKRPLDHVSELLLRVAVPRNNGAIGQIPMHGVELFAIANNLKENAAADVPFWYAIIAQF